MHTCWRSLGLRCYRYGCRCLCSSLDFRPDNLFILLAHVALGVCRLARRVSATLHDQIPSHMTSYRQMLDAIPPICTSLSKLDCGIHTGQLHLKRTQWSMQSAVHHPPATTSVNSWSWAARHLATRSKAAHSATGLCARPARRPAGGLLLSGCSAATKEGRPSGKRESVLNTYRLGRCRPRSSSQRGTPSCTRNQPQC